MIWRKILDSYEYGPILPQKTQRDAEEILIQGKDALSITAMIFTTEFTEVTEKIQDQGGNAVPVAAFKAASHRAQSHRER